MVFTWNSKWFSRGIPVELFSGINVEFSRWILLHFHRIFCGFTVVVSRESIWSFRESFPWNYSVFPWYSYVIFLCFSRGILGDIIWWFPVEFSWNGRCFPVEFALIFPVIFPWNSRVRRSRAQNYANPVSGLSSSTNSGKKSKKNRNRGKQQEKTARNDAFEETVKTPREQNDDNTAEIVLEIQIWENEEGRVYGKA